MVHFDVDLLHNNCQRSHGEDDQSYLPAESKCNTNSYQEGESCLDLWSQALSSCSVDGMRIFCHGRNQNASAVVSVIVPSEVFLKQALIKDLSDCMSDFVAQQAKQVDLRCLGCKPNHSDDPQQTAKQCHASIQDFFGVFAFFWEDIRQIFDGCSHIAKIL